jgi:methylmalonyl-CoA/ethylmalonyl-CoA epimerase
MNKLPFLTKNSPIIIVVLLLAILTLSFRLYKQSQKDAFVKTKTITQVAIVVKDVDKVRLEWAKFLGVEAPATSIAASHESRPTQYKGEPTDAKAKLAFFNLDNIQIELIQPLGGKSTWQEYLDSHGEGIHHIAFSVQDINGVEKQLAVQAMPTVQSGGWNGGAYSYIDASGKLGCILELLENYNK